MGFDNIITMKNTIYAILFLTGCATFSNSQNEFYHRFAAKPTIVESNIGNGEWLETVPNPYDVAIIATVDCDNEKLQRVFTINSNDSIMFKTISEIDHNCSVLHWEVK